MLWIMLLLASLGTPFAASSAQVTAVDPSQAEREPVPGFDRMDEQQLRAWLQNPTFGNTQRTRAIAAMRRRFPSDAAQAFASNAEAKMFELRDPRRSLRLYEAVLAQFSASKEPTVEAEIVGILQGRILAEEMREAIDDPGGSLVMTAETLDSDSLAYRWRRDLVARYVDRRDPAIRRIVAQERFNLTSAEAIEAGRNTDPRTFLALVAEYEDSSDAETQVVIADIFTRLGFFETDRRKQIGYFDEILRRFGTSRDTRFRRFVSDAYANKEYALAELGEKQEASRVQAAYHRWLDEQPN